MECPTTELKSDTIKELEEIKIFIADSQRELSSAELSMAVLHKINDVIGGLK